MFKIDNIETNPISGMTDLEITFKLFGKESKTYRGSYLKRYDACAMVRASLLQYFQTNIERFMLACFWACENSQTDHWNGRRSKALDICSKYHEYLFKPEATYTESLQYYLRIQSEFRDMLPGKKNSLFNSLDKQLRTFENLAGEFYLEFTKYADKQMSQYQKQHILQAS